MSSQTKQNKTKFELDDRCPDTNEKLCTQLSFGEGFKTKWKWVSYNHIKYFFQRFKKTFFFFKLQIAEQFWIPGTLLIHKQSTKEIEYSIWENILEIRRSMIIIMFHWPSFTCISKTIMVRRGSVVTTKCISYHNLPSKR